MTYYLIIRGPMGSGKSTISERLSSELGARHIAVDRILDEHSLTGEHEEGYISQRSFKCANEIIAPEAAELLAKNIPVIFDGNFYWQSQIEDLVGRLDFPHKVFTLELPLALCIERDSKRDKTHGKDATEAVYAKSTSFTYGVPIDVTGTLDESTAAIKQNLPV